jgi:hypothetical protein
LVARAKPPPESLIHRRVVAGKTTSPILLASMVYWDWFGRFIDSIFKSSRRRHRSFFVFGGCLTWLFIISFVWIFWAMVITLVVSAIFCLTLVGALLSAVGWADQGRINLVANRHANSTRF